MRQIFPLRQSMIFAPSSWTVTRHVRGGVSPGAALKLGRNSSRTTRALATMAVSERLILLFRNDLRLHDNVIVHTAAQATQSRSDVEVVPLYCFDPRQFILTPWGNLKTGNFRAQFLLESVLDLREQLLKVGSNLIVRYGLPEQIINDLIPEEPTTKVRVLMQAEVTSEELAVEKKVAQALGDKGRVERFWGPTMYHREDLPFKDPKLNDMPDVFTPFRQKVEASSSVRKLLPKPVAGSLRLPANAADLHSETPVTVEDLNVLLPDNAPRLQTPQVLEQAVLAWKGGETAALARVKYYSWDSDLLATYFDTRNGMLGGDFSTKLSPWLALGCVSPRYVYHEIRKYESQRTSNKSTYWVIFELIWRDFYRFFTLKHGNSIFLEEGIVSRPVQWDYDKERFERWREGRTGMPLVDANMRELKATGYMSNRGRQNVASYLALDMCHDWRAGADWFESVLTDYDVCSNWGNWVAAAGLTGGRINKFNITKQSKDYDLKGDYIRAWVPELRKVPSSRIHEPWLMSKEEQQQFGLQLGVDYPTPIPLKRSQEQNDGGHSSRGGHHTRGKGGGRGPRGGGQGGRGGRGNGSARRRPSEFEMYG